MSDNEKKANQKPAASTDLGQQEVQDAFDEANAKGYFGVTTDPTPDENYSLQTPPDAPTPETDADQAAKVREYQAGLSRNRREKA